MGIHSTNCKPPLKSSIEDSNVGLVTFSNFTVDLMLLKFSYQAELCFSEFLTKINNKITKLLTTTHFFLLFVTGLNFLRQIFFVTFKIQSSVQRVFKHQKSYAGIFHLGVSFRSTTVIDLLDNNFKIKHFGCFYGMNRPSCIFLIIQLVKRRNIIYTRKISTGNRQVF